MSKSLKDLLKTQSAIAPPNVMAKIERDTQAYLRSRQKTVEFKALEAEDYDQSGDRFVEACGKYAFTDRGIKPRLYDWTREFQSLIGDLRLAEVYTTGAAQIGKTANLTWLIVYLQVNVMLRCLWVYDQASSRQKNKPQQFDPVCTKWIKEYNKIEAAKRDRILEKQNENICIVDGVPANFRHASTSKTSGNRAADVGSALASITGDITFEEERSQWDPGTPSLIPARLQYSTLKTRPRRPLGTPGNGGGIEQDIEYNCQYYFSPHLVCPHCGEEIELSPLGCLLRPINQKAMDERGDDPRYLSISGRPVRWFHHDDKDPYSTAYFGCPHCESELHEPFRSAYFKDIKGSGLTLKEYREQLSNGVINWTLNRQIAAIWLSPLLRDTEACAAEIITNGRTTQRPADWQQQALGVPSAMGDGSITLVQVKSAIDFPFFPEDLHTTSRMVKGPWMVGMDQGRGQHWLMIARPWLPYNWRKRTWAEVMDSAVHEVEYLGAIDEDSLVEKLEPYRIRHGLIDADPERKAAAIICDQVRIKMARRQDTLPDANFKLLKNGIKHGGRVYKCYALRSPEYMTILYQLFMPDPATGYPRIRFNEKFQQWVVRRNEENSPVKHLLGPRYDNDLGRWIRPDDHLDDCFFAAKFYLGAFDIWLRKPGQAASQVSFGLPNIASTAKY